MKIKLSIIAITIVILFGFSLPPIFAQSGDVSTAKYVLILHAQMPEFDKIPVGLDEFMARNYVIGLLHKQTEPLTKELDKMVAEGKIKGYEIRPDIYGIIVQGAAKSVEPSLRQLAENATVLPLEKAVPTCATEGSKAFTEQLVAMSHLKYLSEHDLDPLASSTTDPSIEAYAPVGSSYSSVYGKTKPNISVNMRILHGSQVIATMQTTSNSDGKYFFRPDWHYCPSFGFDWTLRPGDIVEVTAHNNTVRTRVTYLLAWANPDTNRVEGYSQTGHKVEVTAIQPKDNSCDSTQFTLEKSVEQNGSFNIDFHGVVDFDRRAMFDIIAKDNSGNGTTIFIFPFQVSIFDFNSLIVTLKPYTRFTATIFRSGHQLATFQGITSWMGSFYQGLDDIQPGDDLQISGGGVTIRYHVIPLTSELDAIHNKVTGTTSPRRLIEADIYERTSPHWDKVMTSCEDEWACNIKKADGNGKFDMGMNIDVTPGDYGYVYVFDDEGNYQSQSMRTSAIIANLSYQTVSGYWKDPSTPHVDIILKKPDGSVKETHTHQWVDGWDGSFDTWFSSRIEPRDIIEVKATNGTGLESMRVQDLSAQLDTNSGKLIGESGQGKLLAWLNDFRRSSGDSDHCMEKNNSGHYELTFSGAQIGAQDHGILWLLGGDGHYTAQAFDAFSVNTRIGDQYVWGYTKTPSTSVTVSLQRNGSIVETKRTVSSSGRYFQVNFEHVTIQTNDILQVNAQDNESVTLPIPQLTVEKDVPHNQLVGQAPANQPIHSVLHRIGSGVSFAIPQIGATNASGHYAVPFDGLFWWSDCSIVQVGQRCIQPEVKYYSPNGHSISLEGPRPAPVSADDFEPDNNTAQASHYSAIQPHSFHVSNDVDWVAFNVSAQDVGNTFRIETFNLGSDEDTHLYLYDTNGSTLLAEDDDGGIRSASKIMWSPAKPGRYYVKVTPDNEYAAAYCGASYDLIITSVRDTMYLPLALQSYR